MSEIVAAQMAALKVLQDHKLAANRPSEYQRRIAAALLGLSHGIKELRDALQANPARRASEVSPHDPRRQSSAVQDIVTEEILRVAAELLPKSALIRTARKAALAHPGNVEIDDRKALVRIARLVIESGGKKRPKTAAREIASEAGGLGVQDSTIDRLRRKYTTQALLYEALAAAQIRQEPLTEAKRLPASHPDTEAISEGDEEIAPLAERMMSNANTARVVERLKGTQSPRK
jgi:hypothetical protein